MPRKVLIIDFSDDASSYYRQTLPARHLYNALLARGIELVHQAGPPDYCPNNSPSAWSAIIGRCLYGSESLARIGTHRVMGSQFVYNLDDNLLDIPPGQLGWTPSVCNQVAWGMAQAAYIWASTEPLAERVGLPDITRVLPNLIDPKAWTIARESAQPLAKAGVRIVWSGSSVHRAAISSLAGPLKRLLDRSPGQAEFCIFGDLAPELKRDLWCDGCYYEPWVAYDRYPAKLCSLQADIVLAPQEDDPFHACQSNNRLLESTLAGATLITADIGPYASLPADCGWKVPPDAGEQGWDDALAAAVSDPEERAKRHRRASEWVLTEWSWASSAKKQLWLDAYLEVAGG